MYLFGTNGLNLKNKSEFVFKNEENQYCSWDEMCLKRLENRKYPPDQQRLWT